MQHGKKNRLSIIKKKKEIFQEYIKIKNNKKIVFNFIVLAHFYEIESAFEYTFL